MQNMIDVINQIPRDRRDEAWRAIATRPLTQRKFVSFWGGKTCPLAAAAFAVKKQPVTRIDSLPARQMISQALDLSIVLIDDFIREWDHAGYWGRRRFVRHARAIATA